LEGARAQPTGNAVLHPVRLAEPGDERGRIHPPALGGLPCFLQRGFLLGTGTNATGRSQGKGQCEQTEDSSRQAHETPFLARGGRGVVPKVEAPPSQSRSTPERCACRPCHGGRPPWAVDGVASAHPGVPSPSPEEGR